MDKEDNISTTVVGGNTTVVGGDEGEDDAVTARLFLRTSVSYDSAAVSLAPLPDKQSSELAASQNAATLVRTNSTTSGQQLSSSATGCRPPTNMIPLARPQTQQQGNGPPDFPGNRICIIMVMMMMNQASDRDTQWHKREERHKEFCRQIELHCQQMQQQQNVMTILLMNAVGMTNPQQQQLGFSNISTTNNQQQHNEGDKGKSK